MRQIVGLIQAFLHAPQVVLLDEPTTGLDPLMQEALYDLLAEERRRGCTIFFSSHVLSEVERVCDRVGLIRDGRLVRTEEVARHRETSGKRVRVVPRDNAAALCDALSQLDGVQDINRTEAGITFLYTGRIERLMHALAGFQLEDFECRAPSIQELFMRLYQDETDDSP